MIPGWFRIAAWRSEARLDIARRTKPHICDGYVAKSCDKVSQPWRPTLHFEQAPLPVPGTVQSPRILSYSFAAMEIVCTCMKESKELLKRCKNIVAD